MLNLQNQLNETQYQAAINIDGPMLVIAGAGSGKTRVITYRIANLIKNHNIPPWRIMAVTFTNKAAKEMAHRVESLTDEGDKCFISTFHSSCTRFLRKWADQFGINPQFTIYDDQDQKAMVLRVCKELDICTKQFAPKSLQNEINKAKRELITPDEYPQNDFYRRHAHAVYALYEQRMKDAHALDFGDLLSKTVMGMHNNEEIARQISGQFDYVLVDEFQDTNKVQLELVRLLTPHKNICVVGDDDQSIYSWRGADISNILEFDKIFPNAKVVKLEQNYRSTNTILKASHSIVSKLPNRRPKELWTDNPDGDKIASYFAEDEREEARFVANQIKAQVNSGVSHADQAVFYRTNAQSRVFEEVFRAMNIPHRIVGGMRFYERAEIKDLLAYLRLISNSADHTAFMRIVNTPVRGIGKTTLDKLVTIAASNGISAYEAIDSAQNELKPAAISKLTQFKDMVQRWKNAASLGPSKLAQAILDDTGYIKLLESENTAEADARIENIKEFMGSLAEFEEDAQDPTLASYLELVTLQTDIDNADFSHDQVTLMTVHAAKGLEFDTVYVTGLEETLFPLIKKEVDAYLNEDELDEERRLAYVAMTRAQKKLFLVRALQRRLFGQIKVNNPSRFIAEIPRDILQSLNQATSKPTRRSSEGAYFKTQGFFNKPSTKSVSLSQKKPGTSDVWIDNTFDQSDSNIRLFPGQAVSHAKFGKGKIAGIIPGAKPKVDVVFPGWGRKTILAKYLELE